MGILDKIADIEAEISRTQKNKATEGHLGVLKAKLAKYRAELIEDSSSSGPKGEGFDVMKSGNARVSMIGFPSVGKSTLLGSVTDTESCAAAYEFTTLTCIPGVIHYNDAKIQLLDLPGIIEGAAKGKGRGKQVIAVARTADCVLMVLDALKADNQKEKLTYELEQVGIRLNKSPPNIYFKAKKGGGIAFNTTVPNTHGLNDKSVYRILHEYKIHNAEVLLREDSTLDDFVDVIIGNRLYMKCVYCYNKVDQITIEEVDRLAREPNSVVISSKYKMNLDYMISYLWEQLGMVRVYSKKPGQKPDLDEGIILREGATVEHCCHAIHRSLIKDFKYALVWGRSVKFSPQRVAIGHNLMEDDVIQIVTQ